MTAEYREEKDSMGEMNVPKAARYGAQTQRAVENFQISGQRLPVAPLSEAGLTRKTVLSAANDRLQGDPGHAVDRGLEVLV